MTTLPITLEGSAGRNVHFPAGWWLLPSVVVGAGIWIVGLTALFF